MPTGRWGVSLPGMWSGGSTHRRRRSPTRNDRPEQNLTALLRAAIIAAAVLGGGALPPKPSIALAVVVPAALALHYALSAVYGAVFGLAVAGIDALRHDRIVLVGAATTYGLLLWIINFHMIAPIVFPYFSMTDTYVQFVVHTIFFGTTLGLSLARRIQPSPARTGHQ